MAKIIISRDKLLFVLWGLILCFAFLSSAPVNPEARAGLVDAGYNLFRRYGFGIIATWDILLFGTFFSLIYRNSFIARPLNLLNRTFNNPIINVYFILLTVSIVVGLIVILFSQVHVFVIRDWFRAVLPILYLLMTYFIVVNIIKSRESVFQAWQIFELIAAAMVGYGFIRLIFILNGQIQVLTPWGIPIILYSELVWFNLPINFYLLKISLGERIGVFCWFLLLCMVVFILISTRRMNYILLVLNPLIVFIIARKSGLVTLGKVAYKMKLFFVIFFLVGFGLTMAIPDLFDAILVSIQTINVFSEGGGEYTGEFRLVQFENIISNLTSMPITWLTGFGIGTKWYVFQALPTTIDSIGSFMAYDAKVLSAGSDWLPFFHINFISSLFRFGLIGMFTLFVIVVLLYRHYTRYIRSVKDKNDQILLASLSGLVLMPIRMLGDQPSPEPFISLAINLGLLESYRLATST